MSAPIYLDHNATTPILPEVVDAMMPFLRDHFGNPSSAHSYGRRAALAVDTARAQVAALVGAQPDEIVFTGCGTEASNLAITGLLQAVSPGSGRLITSSIEHPATTAPARELARQGTELVVLPVGSSGQVDLDAARAALASPTTLVSIMHANNETGVLQPIAELSALAKAAGACMHTDAAQSLGKLPVHVDELGVDLLTLAGHKLYAPKGIGALYVRTGTPIGPVLRGGGHERGIRPGTENVPYIVGLGVACAIARRDLESEGARVKQLRDRLEGRLCAAIPGAIVHGAHSPRLPNTCNLRLPGVRGAQVLEACPQVAASTGSACHEGVWAPSSVLLAMGVAPDEALGALRLTLGRATRTEHVNLAADALVNAWVKLTGTAS